MDLPLFFEMDCYDDPWLIKDITNTDCFINSNADSNVFCNCNEYSKYSRISSEAVNIPQIPLFVMNEKELWESQNCLDTDINFYGSHFKDKSFANALNTEEEYDPISLWGTPMDIDSLKLGEIFQVEESEANQGPTLAQLNSNYEPLETLNFNDYSEETKPSITDNFINKLRTDSIGDLTTNTSEAKISIANNNEICLETTHVKTENKEVICLPDLCANYSLTSNVNTNQINTSALVQTDNTSSINIPNTPKLQQLLDGNLSPRKESFGLSSAMNSNSTENVSYPLTMVSHVQNEMIVRQRNNSSTDRSLCSFSSLSNDEGFDSSRDEFCLDDDGSSDIDSGDGADKYRYNTWYPLVESRQKFSDTKKKKRYFWQYNIQSKGPKGPKIALEQSNFLDPYILSKASDPVFNIQYHLDGVKHAGKARRGDGNDLTPNPYKLYSIGLELKKLTKVINDLEPTIDQPFNIRPKSRREKNKLASRVCRLKKKAQHEANKLKLYGLQKEHYNLLVLIEEIKPLFKETLEGNNQSSLTQNIEKLFSLHEPTRVAGRTTEFVNGILERVSEGDPNGGLCEL